MGLFGKKRNDRGSKLVAIDPNVVARTLLKRSMIACIVMAILLGVALTIAYLVVEQ